MNKKIIQEIKLENEGIPFLPQAPFCEWNDPRQQDGCEEATSIMAIYARRGKILTFQEGKDLLLKLSAYQTQQYDSACDTSAQDTAERILKGYFQYAQVEVKSVHTEADLIWELLKGNLLIVPANGQLLQNPYFTPPGPVHHMLLIHGYDLRTGEFITHDPGTKRGANYRYSSDVLFQAIRDYPTGKHVVVEKIEKKMIVID